MKMPEFLVTMRFRGNRAPHRYYLIEAARIALAKAEAEGLYRAEGPMRLDCYPDVALVDGDLEVPPAARHLFED
jgi:hypothetical protein